MSLTLQQLRERVKTKLDESAQSHFTDDVLNNYINEAINFTAVFIEYPKDLVYIQVQNNVGDYTLPSDTLYPRMAYFGDPSSKGDVKPLIFVTEDTLKEIAPNLMDNTSDTQGRPTYIYRKSMTTVSLFPRPSAQESASGKYLFLNYTFNPSSITADSQTPAIPPIYHDILQFYALHLCYIQLQNKDMSDSMLNGYLGKIKLIKAQTTKESKEAFGFQWGNVIDVSVPDMWVLPQ